MVSTCSLVGVVVGARVPRVAQLCNRPLPLAIAPPQPCGSHRLLWLLWLPHHLPPIWLCRILGLLVPLLLLGAGAAIVAVVAKKEVEKEDEKSPKKAGK